jgi:hypothetical protein
MFDQVEVTNHRQPFVYFFNTDRHLRQQEINQLNVEAAEIAEHNLDTFFIHLRLVFHQQFHGSHFVVFTRPHEALCEFSVFEIFVEICHNVIVAMFAQQFEPLIDVFVCF